PPGGTDRANAKPRAPAQRRRRARVPDGLDRHHGAQALRSRALTGQLLVAGTGGALGLAQPRPSTTRKAFAPGGDARAAHAGPVAARPPATAAVRGEDPPRAREPRTPGRGGRDVATSRRGAHRLPQP